MFRKYVLVGTLIMHDSYFAKVACGDKFYLDKALLAVATNFCSNIRIEQWFEPWVPPEKRHISISLKRVNGDIFLLLELVNHLIHTVIGLLQVLALLHS